MDPRDAAKKVGTLLDGLGSFSDEKRQKTLAGLIEQFGEVEAVNLLAALLRHPHEDKHEPAGTGLALLGRHDLLLEGANSGDARVRYAAAYGLASAQKEVAFEPLARLARDPDFKVADRAILDLGWHGEPGWQVVLRIGASTDQPRLQSTVRLVFTRAWRETVTYLVRILEEDDPSLRGIVLSTLERMPLYEWDMGTTEPLLRALGRVEDPDQKRSIAWALRGNQDPRVAPALLPLLAVSDSGILAEVIQVLGDTGDPRALPALTDFTTSNDKAVREAAVRAVGQLNSPEALPYLKAAMRDPSAEMRKAAAGSLGHLPGKGGIETLCAALEDPDAGVRTSAAYALGNRCAPKSLPALRKRMKPEVEADPKVRKAARHAIDSLGFAGVPGISVFPTHTGRLVPESPDHSRVGLRRTDVPCTCCGGTCHEVFSVPGEQIGRAGKYFRLIRCMDCYFIGPHYVYWRDGQPVRVAFDDGDAQGFLRGKFREAQASILWEPAPPPSEYAQWERQTFAGPRPEWCQDDEWPYCPECRLEMEFVFQLASTTLDTSRNKTEVTNGFYLWLEHYATFFFFACERCQVTATVSQCS